MNIRRSVTTAAIVAILILPLTAHAGGRHGSNSSTVATCTATGTTVQATGLPVGPVINFMMTTSSGTADWVLGVSDNGSWSVPVPAPTSPTTYQFVSRTWGPEGSKYDVFASCSA